MDTRFYVNVGINTRATIAAVHGIVAHRSRKYGTTYVQVLCRLDGGQTATWFHDPHR